MLRAIIVDPMKSQDTDWTTRKDGKVSWDKTFDFDARLPSKLKIEAYKSHHHWHKLSRSILVASFEEELRVLLESDVAAVDGVKRDLTKPFNIVNANNNFSIVFSISISNEEQKESNAVVEATDAAQNIQVLGLVEPFAPTLNTVSSVVENADNFAVLWNDVWKKAGIFLEWVNGVAEVHPFAKIAVQVLSSVYKVIDAQIRRDKSILQLLHIMSEAYDFGREAEPVKEVESQRIALKCLSQQTIECAYFISAYSKDCRFIVKAVKNLFSTVDDAVQEYKTRFQEIRKAFDSRAILNTEITVMRMAKETFDIAVTLNLNDIPYAGGARYKSENQCPPGSHTEILDEISVWINDPNDDRRVCVLTGSGTSAIAHTIALRMDEIDRLGSSFCFDSKKLATRGPNVVLPTIIGDVALRDPLITKALVDITKNDRSLRHTESLHEQFEKLVLKPVRTLSTTGPIVVVIDALDQSGDTDSRRDLLELLATRLQELPQSFRFFLTSLPEDDILERFRDQKGILLKEVPFSGQRTITTTDREGVEAQTHIESQRPQLPNKIEDSYQTESNVNQNSDNDFSVNYDYDFDPNGTLPHLHQDRRPSHSRTEIKEPKDYFPNTQNRPAMLQPPSGSGTLIQKSFNLRNEVMDGVGNDYSQNFGGSRSTTPSSGKRSPSPRVVDADADALLDTPGSEEFKTKIIRSGNTHNTLVKDSNNDYSIHYGRKTDHKKGK
ncbi:hypothetical protein GALMADRAFT_232848 [Galerina marginata CBS 339.88]|uniref:Nephrocystin 3-like N-terminal domain-containing protein n=1 Tax=Galerina marginata (strain CBS 339.88) TaxID=685588 RepID=A0A067SDP7_GALM3|nr:hypothetical protein GALMADRAFT_232848 [Galerina marginata CBS 339.88]